MAGFPNPTMGNDSAQDRAAIDRGGHDDITPAIAIGASAGGGASAAMNTGSTDVRGSVTIIAGTAPASGVIATITFSKAFDKAPIVMLTRSQGGVDTVNYSSSGGVSSFTITASAGIAGTVVINYLVIQ